MIHKEKNISSNSTFITRVNIRVLYGYI